MSKLKIIFYIFLGLLLIFGITILLIEFFKPKMAGLIVNSTPAASVYINGVFVGKTQYTGTNKAEQINLKLVPDNNNMNPYETKINLISGTKTVIDREFGVSEDVSSGDVISFDKINGNLAGLIVISTPDNAQVLIDDVPLGNTPYSFNSITTGAHKITIKRDGYADRTMNVKTASGLKLTVFVKLAKGNNQSLLSASPSPTPLAVKAFVLIKDTPTGFLRMRTEPDTKGEEIAELKSGSKYGYLDTDASTGWFKIQYKEPVAGLPEGITGWVSNQYSYLSTPSASLQ